MLLSHEMPLWMLREGWDETWNDFSYGLVHLFEENKEYFNHYVEMLDEGRMVILDNSIFELGTAFEASAFAKWANALLAATKTISPNLYYVIPDVLNDTEATINNAVNFLSNHNIAGAKPMAVAQGQTQEELTRCFVVLRNLGIKLIGVPYDSKAYLKMIPQSVFADTEVRRYVHGRQLFIEYLVHTDYINLAHDTKIHLLGIALPQEYAYYTKEHPALSKFVYSGDTSNPIVHGLLGIKYGADGLDTKNSMKLAHMLNSPKDTDTIPNVIYNLNKFRTLANLPLRG
jgi:hypothetical protein